MKIIVSACLLGQNCKYNGGNNYSEKLAEYLKDHEVIPVCPEVLGGLPTPRIPSEIRNGIVVNREEICVDKEFRLGAQIALKTALDVQADLAILQSRSPSCGPKQVYDGTFSKKLIDGRGVFADLLAQNHIRIMDVEDIPNQL